MIGIITGIIHGKGYGFIRGEDDIERFLHAKDLMDDSQWLRLKKNDRVEFEPKERPTVPGRKNNCGVTKVRLV